MALRQVAAVVAVLVLGVVLAGCGSDDSASEAPDLAGSSRPVSVIDQRGARVELDAPARRIVTLPMPAAAMVIAVDQGPEHLVGMHAASRQAIVGEIMGEMFPGAVKIAADVANAEFAPNVESLLRLQPDVVIQWGDRGEEVIAPMTNAGLNVVGLNYGTQQDLERWLETFGTLLGKEARARRMVDGIHEDLRALRSRPRGGGRRPKILYFNRLKEGLTVAGRGTYNDFYIKLVGGVNAAGGVKGMAPVNAEQVLAWDPDIVLVGNFDPGTPRDVYRNAAWKGLRAVRSKRVYQVPIGGYRWDPPSQESPLMWRWLAAIAGGGDAAGLREEMREQYRFLYGHELTDKQIDRILRVDLNAGAAGYERFRAG